MTAAPKAAGSRSGPFHDRPAEWDLYLPLVGDSMLELGNKRNGEFTYKAHFEALGYRHVSVDWNGKDGALSRDLRKPLDLGTFSVVSNIGTSEHVENQYGVWANLVNACHVGSVLICTTPKPGDWTWHGDHYPQDGFYRDLARLNGFEIERLYEFGVEPRRMWFCRMLRVALTNFRMPVGNMYRNFR